MDTKETTTYYAVLIAAAVIGTIICYFVVSIIRLQRKHRLLYRTKTEDRILTLEKEKMRVAADLHDELGPVLSAAKLKLSNIEITRLDDERLKTESMQHIDSILQQVRCIANDLVPNTLLRKGAIPAIEEYIARTVLSNSLKITFYKTSLHNFPLSSQVHIYRILQEIIHNTVKHAHAHRLHIELHIRQGKLILATADDGKGFKPATVEKNTHGMGLSNLRSRAEMLGAEMFINSKPAKGARYLFHIPLTTT